MLFQSSDDRPLPTIMLLIRFFPEATGNLFFRDLRIFFADKRLGGWTFYKIARLFFHKRFFFHRKARILENSRTDTDQPLFEQTIRSLVSFDSEYRTSIEMTTFVLIDARILEPQRKTGFKILTSLSSAVEKIVRLGACRRIVSSHCADRGPWNTVYYIIHKLSNWNRLIEENSSAGMRERETERRETARDGEGGRGGGGGGWSSSCMAVVRVCLCVIPASYAESVPLMRGNNDLACLSPLFSAGLTLFASSNASNNALSLSLGSIRARPVSREDRQQVSLCDRIRNRHSSVNAFLPPRNLRRHNFSSPLRNRKFSFLRLSVKRYH